VNISPVANATRTPKIGASISRASIPQEISTRNIPISQFPLVDSNRRKARNSSGLFSSTRDTLVTHLAKKLQPAFKLGFRREQFIFAVKGILRIAKHELVILAHDDRFLRTNLLAKSAKDATQHINLKLYRVALLEQIGLTRLHFDRQWWTDPRAKSARNATFDSVIFHHEYRPSTKCIGRIPTLFRILACELRSKDMFECGVQAANNLRQIKLLPKGKLPRGFVRVVSRLLLHVFSIAKVLMSL
jgi:hypothetical protein